MEDIFVNEFEIDSFAKKSLFIWKVENFLFFKEIMEIRKIFSKFFQVGGCELRIGRYIILDVLFKVSVMLFMVIS